MEDKSKYFVSIHIFLGKKKRDVEICEMKDLKKDGYGSRIQWEM